MDRDRQNRYIEILQRMIRLETVSDPSCASSPENFRQFRELLKELFPHIFGACEVREFNGSLLMKWKGTVCRSLPVWCRNHYDVGPAKPEGWK